MTPITQGAAASWFATLFGGAGQPTTTSTAAADTPLEWSSFAAFLQSEMGSSLTLAGAMPTVDPTDTADADADEDTDDAATLAAATVADLAPVQDAVTAWSGELVTPVVPANSDALATEAAVDGGATPVETTGPTISAAQVANALPVTEPTSSQTATDALHPGAAVDRTAPSTTTDAVPVPAGDGTTDVSPERAIATSASETPATETAGAPTTETHDLSEGRESAQEPVTEVATDPSAAMPIARDTAPDAARDPKPAVQAVAVEGAYDETSGTTPVTSTQTAATATDAGAVVRTATESITNPTPATVANESADPAVHEAIQRVHVRSTKENSARDNSAARELGARLAVRPATAPTPAPGADGVAGPRDEAPAEVPRESIQETLVEEFLEDEAAHEAADTMSEMRDTTTRVASSDADEAVGRTRAAAVTAETTAAPTATPEAAPAVDRSEAPGAATAHADLGARLREAIVETLAAEARDEMLASARDSWEATVRVDPVNLGRVDVQVSRTEAGLEVVLIAAHEEAARALDAEVDDMIEELVRRDTEPAKITVRAHDGGGESDRNGRSPQDHLAARLRGRDDESSTERDGENRRGRGRDRQEFHEREARG